MEVVRCIDYEEVANESARFVAESIIATVAATGSCRIILATGASQFGFLNALIRDWNNVVPWGSVT